MQAFVLAPKLRATLGRDVTPWMIPASKREAADAEAAKPLPFVVCGASISKDGTNKTQVTQLGGPQAAPSYLCVHPKSRVRNGSGRSYSSIKSIHIRVS